MKKITILVVGVCTMLSAMCGMPVNPKLPMSFGVNSKGGNRFVGEFKDIQLIYSCTGNNQLLKVVNRNIL